MTLQPGAIFAGYKIERMLGAGGMGEVYLANHPHLPRQDALKVLADALCSNDVFRQRFLVEANLACRLRHPNIVAIHDRGEYDNRLWISMDYIEGRDLEVAIKQDGPFPYLRALNVMKGIASAVQDLHDSHLLHRDIKPANILLTNRRGEEKAYLTDFGIARDAADTLGLTATTQAVMTLPYAAPERLTLQSSQLDRRVDVYSLGCVFYEMLTGRRAFPGGDSRQLLQQLVQEYPPPPSRLVPGLTEEIDRVVFRSIAKNRDERFSDSMEFLRALEVATPVQTKPQPPTVTHPAPPLTIYYRGEGLPSVQVSSEQLPPAGRERLLRTLAETYFFQLDPQLPSTHWQGGQRELAVQASNGTKSVGWQGQPPLAIAALVQTVEELSGGRPEKKQKKSKKPWVIGGSVAAAVLAGAAVALILLLQPSKPPIPVIPANVIATAQPGSIKLSWLPSKDADHYVVYRDNSVLNSDVRTTSFVDNRGNDMSTHSYAVIAVSIKDKQSVRSEVVRQAAKMRGLNSAEQALVKRLPVGLVRAGSCIPSISTETSAIDAAIDCDLLDQGSAVTPTQQLLAYHNVSLSEYQSNVKNSESGLTDTGAGCAAGAPEATTWSHNDVTVGAFYCYFTDDASQNPALAWTTDANFDTLIIFNAPKAGKPGLIRLSTYWNAIKTHATT